MKIYRLVRWVILAGLIVSVFLLFKTPDPVSKPQDSRAIAANVDSYQSKMQQLVSCPGDFVSTDATLRVGVSPTKWFGGVGVGANVFPQFAS